MDLPPQTGQENNIISFTRILTTDTGYTELITVSTPELSTNKLPAISIYLEFNELKLNKYYRYPLKCLTNGKVKYKQKYPLAILAFLRQIFFKPT